MKKLYLDENKKLRECRGSEEAAYVHMSIEEYNALTSIMQNLKRINKEKSNQERNIQPKKQRSGYILLGYDTAEFRIKFKEIMGYECRRLLLESPYSVELKYRDALTLAVDDLAKIACEFGAALVIEKTDIVNETMFSEYFNENSEKILFITGLEAQRNGQWAIRLFANFTPDVPVDLIKNGGKDNDKK